MRKIVSILTVLLLAAPAMAAVSITVTDNGDCTATISYSDNGDPNFVRAFALDITVDNDANITAVDAAMAGDCNATDKGYGIFPGSFAREINASDPNWAVPGYTPVGYTDDLPGDTQPGIDTGGVTVEMGSLYVDGNEPPASGDLCTVTVSNDCNMTVTVNAGRAGVVLEDATAVTPNLTGATGVPVVCDVGCACMGDMNRDGWKMLPDLYMLVGKFNVAGPPYQIPSTSPLFDECGDMNGDGWLMLPDLYMLVGQFNVAGPPYQIQCPPPGP